MGSSKKKTSHHKKPKTAARRKPRELKVPPRVKSPIPNYAFEEVLTQLRVSGESSTVHLQLSSRIHEAAKSNPDIESYAGAFDRCRENLQSHLEDWRIMNAPLGDILPKLLDLAEGLGVAEGILVTAILVAERDALAS